MMTCPASDGVGRAQQDTWTRERGMIQKCTWSPFGEVAFCGAHDRRSKKWRFAVLIVGCRRISVSSTC